ncbi:MAG TPA: hypothetical protein VF459_08190 [Caulobacteraceae bacterium]
MKPILRQPILALAVLAAAGLGACQAQSANIVQQIPGPDGSWDYASFDAAHHRVLISRSFGVEALDLASGKLTQVAPGARVHGSFALPDGRLLITNGATDTVTIANAATGAIEAAIPVGKNPDAAAFDPASGAVMVMNAHSGDISVIDLAQGKEAARIPVGGALEFAAADGAGMLFVNIEDKAEIAAVDTKARQVKAHFKLAGCEEPSGLAYVAPYRLLISSCANGHAKVVSADDGHEVADLAIGPHPDAVLYDQARGLAFIPSAGSLTANGAITVIKVASSTSVTLAGKIDTTRGARTIAEDPATGRLYLPTADYGLGADGKPHAKDGTFRVLVVAP